jgi:thiosulfate reductase cytochrome b subunit
VSEQDTPQPEVAAAPASDGPALESSPAPPEATPAVALVHKHALAVRWLHWINFPVLFLMMWSGLLILWAYDSYPTPKTAFKVPNRVSLYQWGVTPVYAARDTEDYPRPAPERVDIQIGAQLAKGMALHFNLAWVFTLNGVAYVLFLLFSGQWRHLAPRRESFAEAFKVVLHDIGLWKKPLPPGKYNHAQRIAYSGVVVLGLLMVVNGLAIYKPAQLSWLTALFGGYQTARLIHFVITWLFLGFFFVHVAQVIRAGWNNFRAMITGYELKKRPVAAGVEESA